MSASSVGVLPLALGLAAFALCDAANQEYTPPTLNETYASNSQFIAHGLAPLYDFVGLFLRGIQQKDPLPADLLVVNNGTIALNENIDYGSVAQFYVGILAVLCVGLAVVLLAPCIGIIWCCSRCCGSSKHRGQRLYDDDDHVSDRKKQSGGPVLAPLVLSVITCLIVAGVAISFAANAYIENGVGGLGKHITSGTADMRLYIDNAETEVNTILGVNYNDLSTALNNVLAGARTQTTGIVNDFKTSLPLDEIDDMATGIKKILGDLKNIDSNITYCYQTSQSIVAALKEVKQDLKNSCGASCPEEFNNFTSSLKPPDFNQLPSADIEKAISALDTLPTDFDQKLKQGREDVNKIGYEVENVMDKVSKSMNDKIIETGQTLQQRASELLHAATNASETLLQVDQEVSNYQDQYNAYYAKYRINGFAAYNAVILIIAALITLGLVYGSCCLKHSYSFLNIPVFLILLTISTWMLIVMTLFITGVATDRACEFLRRPGDHQLTHLVDALLQKYRGEVANSSQLPPLHSIKYYIEECRNDKTMYEVIDLDSTIHIENILKYVNNFDFAPFLETIDDKMTEVVNVTLLSPGIQRIIEDLKNSDLAQLSWETVKNESDSFQKEAEPLNKLIAEWQEKLGELGKTYKINVSRPVTTLGETLKTAQALQTSIEQLVSLLNESSSDVKLGHKSFPDALQWLLNKAADTQALVAELAPRVTKLANDTADGFRQEFRAYLQWVVDRVKSDAFKCKPIINIYDSMVVGVCDEIISPWNAYWALSGLCLLLFIPSAFVASSLASYKF